MEGVQSLSTERKAVSKILEQSQLDESLYNLEEDEVAFFKSQTGIQDDEALKQHIINVQTEAYKVYPYPCIRMFAFTSLRISKLSAYDQLLKLGKERKGAILLDIGCCFGNDIRKAVADGFPAQNAIGSDLQAEFWDLGHKLFNSTPVSFPAQFIPGDALDTNFVSVDLPLTDPPSEPAPELGSLKTLTPLRGHISAIHASSFFHLFNEAQQAHLARAMAGLLSPLPGSIIFGGHSGCPKKGLRRDQVNASLRWPDMFGHSSESWGELWDGEVFPKGTVKVDAKVVEVETEDRVGVWWLLWSVTRL